MTAPAWTEPADADGNLDVSPKGDPAGRLAHVIDETTIAIVERPGNRRADGSRLRGLYG